MKTTKPLYIAIGMVLGAAVLALIAAAPNPGVLNVPGIIVRTNGTEIALITSTPGVGQQIKVYSGAANQAQLFVDASQSYLSLVSGSGSSTAFLKALDGVGNSAFQLQSGAGLFNVEPNTPLADIALNLSAIGPTTNYLIWASLNANPQFAVKSASGWTGTGANALMDDGTYKAVVGGSAVWTNSAGVVSLVVPTNTVQMGGLVVVTNGPFNGAPAIVTGAATNQIASWSDTTTPESYTHWGEPTGSSSTYVEMGYDPAFFGPINGAGFFVQWSDGQTSGFDRNGIYTRNPGSAGSGTWQLGTSTTGSSGEPFVETSINGNPVNLLTLNANHSVSIGGTNQWTFGGVTNGAPNVTVDGTDYPLAALNGDGSLSVGGTAPSYFTNGVQDATLTANTLVGNDGTNKLVSATLAMLTNTAAADGNAAHYWNGQGGWTAPVAGSTNITDSGYTADIRNATVATNLTAGSATINTNLAVNGQSGFGGFTVGTLPSGVAAGYETYATDAINTFSTTAGEKVQWDGTVWRSVRTKVQATADVRQFILNCVAAGLNFTTPLMTFNIVTIGNSSTWALTPYVMANTGGTGGNLTYKDGAGAQYYVATGTSSNGFARTSSYYVPSVPAGAYYACGGKYSILAVCDGTDTYWALSGITTPVATYPAAGAFFLYDMYNATGHGQTGPITNHWICVTGSGSAYQYQDSGLTPTVSTTLGDRLAVILTSTDATFYTNGVPCMTNTTHIPTATAMFTGANNIVKTLGSTSRNLYIYNPWQIFRDSAAKPF